VSEPRFCFPRRLRLRLERDFARVYREGSRARGASLTVAVVPNDLGHPRLGLSVGKRCWKRAVPRNRVRRVFREAFRLSVPELPPVDLVMIGSTPRLEPELEVVRRELVHLSRKAYARWREKQAAREAEAAKAEAER